MNEAYTTNPLTGKLIKVGGPVYKSLQRGKATKTALMRSPVRKVKSSHKIKRSARKSPKVKRSARNTKRSVGRGGRTRGWRDISPARGKERTEMLKRCGAKCFLSPKIKGYPICAVNTCKPDCRGIIAAKVRSAQFKEKSVMALAKKMEKRFCL
jgi:hypothetical protein